jgi:hypothetical protein
MRYYPLEYLSNESTIYVDFHHFCRILIIEIHFEIHFGGVL